MISLPFSKSKRYLTGIDWIIHTFDYMTRRATGIGNISQVVLKLNGVPIEDDLRKSLTEFIKKYPVMYGWLKRDYNLAPYWKMPSSGQATPLSFKVCRLENGDNAAAFSLLEPGANMAFNSKREYCAFHLIHNEKKSFLAMTFDHRVFDARGAEAFLGMFQQEWEKRGNNLQKISLTEPANLCRWQEKFKAGQQVNRTFLWLAENAPPRVLPLPSTYNNRKFKFRVISFDEQQTAAIIETAFNKSGYLMLMPYVLAVAIQSLHKIFSKRGISTSDYVIPVSIDMRPPEKVKQEVFFNHVSFFLFRVSADEADSFPVLLKLIKQQMYEQVKSGLPRHIREASFLMRIVPLPILSHLMRLYLKGQIASFCFSYVGETAYTFPRFMGENVHNIFHMPRVPVPPGLGIFFTQFQRKLNAVLSYVEGILSDDEVNTIVHTLQSHLGKKECV